MILPDVNLLVYAHNERAPWHAQARAWWESTLTAEAPVALTWAVVFGFVRLVTHSRVLDTPLTAADALDHVEGWLARPSVRVVEPGPQHLTIVRRLFDTTGVAGALTTDTHLAAIAIEYRCQLCSSDRDFARFPGLKWVNPVG